MVELTRGEDLSRFVDQVRRNLQRVNLPPPLPVSILLTRRLRLPAELEPEPEAARDIGEIDQATRLLTPCEGLRRYGKQIVTINIVVAVGATQVRSTDLLPYPFMITHLVFMDTPTISDQFFYSVFISTNVVRAAGGDQSGIPVVSAYSENSEMVFVVGNAVHELWPNFLNRERNRAIKFVLRNASVSTEVMTAQAEYIRLG